MTGRPAHGILDAGTVLGRTRVRWGHGALSQAAVSHSIRIRIPSEDLFTPAMLQHQIGFVGAGQMARALARGWVRADLVPAGRILAADPLPAATAGFAAEIPATVIAADNLDLVRRSEVVILAVKPQAMARVLAEIRPATSPEKLFVSIAAGIPLERLIAGLGTTRVVRVMPNTPCLVGLGASAYALAAGATENDATLVARLLGAVGLAIRVEEKLLDAVTGLSGSGPAFVYTMIEALSDGGVRMGLPRDAALALAAQTVRGAAEMVLSTAEHPAMLKDRVASPGGTTIAGLEALEQHGVRAGLIAAVRAATERSRELGGTS